MRRRDLLASLALSIGVLAPSAPRVLGKNKLWRIGYLDLNLPPTAERPSCNIRAFKKGLSELGYEESRDYVIEARFADADDSRLPSLAQELVDLDVDVILTFGRVPVRAAKAATTTIPIVTAGTNYLIEDGVIASFAHPGGNVTGLTRVPDGSLYAKTLQLFKELVPNISRLATLGNVYPEMRTAAKQLDITLLEHDVNGVKDIRDFERILSTIQDEQPDTMHVPDNFVDVKYRKEILEFLAKNKLPSMFFETSWVERAEGLLCYFTDVEELRRRAASYVVKILKGAKPGDLPVEQPTRFKLIINLKTAKDLGLTVPQTLMQRADKLIEGSPGGDECEF